MEISHRPTEEKQRLDISEFSDIEHLGEEIYRGLLRLEFTQDHADLVEKLVICGNLISMLLRLAGDNNRMVTKEEIEQLYELQNLLFTHDDLVRLAPILFGSGNVDKDGNIDKNSWFWKLINPLKSVPHLNQANEICGDIIADDFGSDNKERTIVEYGSGGLKTIVSILKRLVKNTDNTLAHVTYMGVDSAPLLADHGKTVVMQNRVPSLLDGDIEAGFAVHNQIGMFRTLKSGIVEMDEMTHHASNLRENSIDTVVVSYVIHHLSCGEAFLRAVRNRRLRIGSDGTVYFLHSSSHLPPVPFPSEMLKRVIFSLVEGDTEACEGIYDAIKSSEKISDKDAVELRALIKNKQLMFLNTVFKALKPGGRVIIADPEQGKSIFNRAVIINDVEGLADFTSVEQMIAMLKDSGFENIQGFAQWEITEEFVDKNRKIFARLNPHKKDPSGYIVAVPLAERDILRITLNEALVDDSLGYLVAATKPLNDGIGKIIDPTRTFLLTL